MSRTQCLVRNVVNDRTLFQPHLLYALVTKRPILETLGPIEHQTLAARR
jgi:hypothetical protein